MSKETKTKKQLKSYSIRANEDTVKAAVKHGVDYAEVFRRALDHALLKVTGRCPTCGVKAK